MREVWVCGQQTTAPPTSRGVRRDDDSVDILRGLSDDIPFPIRWSSVLYCPTTRLFLVCCRLYLLATSHGSPPRGFVSARPSRRAGRRAEGGHRSSSTAPHWGFQYLNPRNLGSAKIRIIRNVRLLGAYICSSYVRVWRITSCLVVWRSRRDSRNDHVVATQRVGQFFDLMWTS